MLDPVARLRLIVIVSIQTAADHPHAVEIYQNEGTMLRAVPRGEHVAALAQLVHQFWAEVIKAGVQALELRSDVSSKLFHRLIRDAVWLSPRWYRPTEAYPPEMLADDLLAVFLDGFSANSPSAQPSSLPNASAATALREVRGDDRGGRLAEVRVAQQRHVIHLARLGAKHDLADVKHGNVVGVADGRLHRLLD